MIALAIACEEATWLRNLMLDISMWKTGSRHIDPFLYKDNPTLDHMRTEEKLVDPWMKG